jgi:hypothetical protein
MKKKPVSSDYAYHDWEFKQAYPVNDERAQDEKKEEVKDAVDYENIMNFEELSLQTQFEDIHSWLDSQDFEFDVSHEEALENHDDSLEKSFYTCLDFQNCSTLKSDICQLKMAEKQKMSTSNINEKYGSEESGSEESVYSLQLRSTSQTLFSSL